MDREPVLYHGIEWFGVSKEIVLEETYCDD